MDASPRGVAAALTACAQGVLVGTCLLTPLESGVSESACERLLQAQETETTLTRVFDLAQGFTWPQQFPGRALRNRFTEEWNAHPEGLPANVQAQQKLEEAIKQSDYEVAFLYAGKAVGLVTQQQPAAAIIQGLGDGAERLLRAQCCRILGDGSD